MSYRVPPLDEQHGFLIAFWKFLFPLSKVQSRYTYHWKRLRVYAGAVADLGSALKSAIDDVMPDTSAGAFLTRWGNIVKVIRKGATGARGSSALQVFGTAGSAITSGMTLQHPPTGYMFQVTTTTVVPAAGFINVDVAAISTGAATRLLKGTVLQFTGSNPGLQQNAKIVVDLTTDGFDAEQDPAYSARVTAEFGEPRMGGHESDFVKWMLEIVGISSAYAYPNRAGIGTVDVVGFHAGTGTARSLTTTELLAAAAYLRTKVPAQLGAQLSGLRVLKTSEVPISVKVAIATNGDPSYAFDWDDTVAPVVSTYTTSPVPTIKFTTSLPSSVLAAKRIVFDNIVTAQNGTMYVIDTVTTTTNPNDTITLRVTPPVALAAGDVAYSGGPLTDVIRNALLAHLNGEIVYADKNQPLGASNAIANGKALARMNILVDALGPVNPGGIYGTWTGDVLVANLMRIATYATGVRNATLTNIPSDLLLADTIFPSDGTILFVTPSAVLVRRA